MERRLVAAGVLLLVLASGGQSSAHHDRYLPREACSHVVWMGSADAGYLNLADLCTYTATAHGGYAVTGQQSWRVIVERHGKQSVYSSAKGSPLCQGAVIRPGDRVLVQGGEAGYGGPVLPC